MAPMFGQPNFSFIEDRSSEEDLLDIELSEPGHNGEVTLTEMAFYYTLFLITVLLIWLLLFFVIRLCRLRQKTRDPQPRRMYVGSRERPSIGQQPPTIYVSPANLPPPPKYEAMAPPSYEEVVGVHYPQYHPPISTQIQPITQPITTAVAVQSNQSGGSVPERVTNSTNGAGVTGSVSTVVTVTNDVRRTSVTVASSG